MLNLTHTYSINAHKADSALQSAVFTPPPVVEKLKFYTTFKRIYDCLLYKVAGFLYSVNHSLDFQEKVSTGCFDHIHTCAFPFLEVRFNLMGAVCLDHIHFRTLLNKMDVYKRLLWLYAKDFMGKFDLFGFCVFNDKFINKKGSIK